MVHEFPLETTGLPFQMFRCTRKFSAGTTHLLSNRIFRKVLVNSKQPWWTQNRSPKPNVQSILPVWLQCDQHGLPNIARRCTLYGAIQEGVTTMMMMMMMTMKTMMCCSVPSTIADISLCYYWKFGHDLWLDFYTLNNRIWANHR